MARFVGPLGRSDAFHRQEKAEIQRSCDQAMKHGRRVLQHEILVIPKERQPVLDKIPERLACALARGRQPAIFRVANILRKPICHLGGDFCLHRALVAPARGRWRRLGCSILFPIAHGFPVLGIIVPRATLGLSIIAHEDPEFLPGLAVVGFHEQPFLSFSKTKKLLARSYELAGRSRLNRNTPRGDGIYDLLLRPVVRLHDEQRFWAVPLQVVSQGIGEIRSVAHFSVIHLPAVFAELVRELAHRCELKHSLDPVGPTRIPRLYKQNDITTMLA